MAEQTSSWSSWWSRPTRLCCMGRACSAGRFTCQSKTHHVRTADSTPQRLPIRHEFETACTARCHIQTDCLSLNYVGPIARRSDMPPTDSIWTRAQIPCCPLSNSFKAAACAYRHLANGTYKTEKRQMDGRIAALLYASTVGWMHNEYG